MPATRPVAFAALLVAACASSLAGQAPAPVRFPPSLVITNYERVRPGEREALEGGAVVARVTGATANWYNPAGLAASDKSSVNASSTAYDWQVVKLEGIGETRSSSALRTNGSYFGVAIADGPMKPPSRWRAGFAVARPFAWRPGTISGGAAAGGASTSYSAEGSFSSFAPILAAAYRLRPDLRIGASVAGSVVSTEIKNTFAARNVTGTNVSSSLQTTSGNGSSWNLVLAGGLQWDATDEVQVGVVVKAPSLRIYGPGNVLIQSRRTTAAGTAELDLRDPDATYRWKEPFQLHGGIAWSPGPATLELNVRHYGAIGEWEWLSVDTTAVVISAPAGQPPVITNEPVPPGLNRTRAVTNVSIGANVRLSQAIRLHAGAFSDRSPQANDSSAVFRQVDFYGATAGLSGTVKGFTGSLGLGYQGGSGGEQLIGTASDGTPIVTRLSVSTLSLLYALSIRF